MKINVTISKARLENAEEVVCADPCDYIECGLIECEQCPLREATQAFRKSQETLIKFFSCITVEEVG